MTSVYNYLCDNISKDCMGLIEDYRPKYNKVMHQLCQLAEAKMKSLLTSKITPIHKKGVDIYQVESFWNAVISTNDLGNIVRNESDDRRFIVMMI